MIGERIQTLIHRLESGAGTRWLNYVLLTVIVLALAVRYDTHCYRNFSSPEAMDAAQVARNLAAGKGFSTEIIRPFDIYLLQKHSQAGAGSSLSATNTADTAQINGHHPDLANAPLYPFVLAGLFKLSSPDWKLETRKSFWSNGGHFQRYKPEFGIALFNQLLLLLAVLLTFLLAKTMLDTTAAWISAILMLCSDELWKFSVSGLPTLLLLVIFLGLAWSLAAFESLGRSETAEKPESRRRLILALAAGLLAGLGMMTRYAFGWVIVPVLVYFILFGGLRRARLVMAAFLVFALTVTPWIVRNVAVSGTFFGTAGYAPMEDSMFFPGSRLMQSLTPEMYAAHQHMVKSLLLKLEQNLRTLMDNDILRLGGGWVGVLFLAGLLLGLRNIAARRLRYFTMLCLGVFLVATALGRTSFGTLSPGCNAENMLVLLLPLAVIFGVVFFLTLLNQMELRMPPVRYGVIVLAIVLVRLQFIMTLLPPETPPSTYPPYYPPDIQKFSGWLQPDELVMSDIPWAVAWYGDRQCTWTTLNCRYDFDAVNDYVKPVNALYLSLNTIDAKLFTECLQSPSGPGNWSRFAYNAIIFKQQPDHFPLKCYPVEALASGYFLADRQRW